MSIIEVSSLTTLPAIAYIMYLSLGGVYFTSPVVATLTMINIMRAGIACILHAPDTYNGQHFFQDMKTIILIGACAYIIATLPLFFPLFFGGFFTLIAANPIVTPLALTALSILDNGITHLCLASISPTKDAEVFPIHSKLASISPTKDAEVFTIHSKLESVHVPMQDYDPFTRLTAGDSRTNIIPSSRAGNGKNNTHT